MSSPRKENQQQTQDSKQPNLTVAENKPTSTSESKSSINPDIVKPGDILIRGGDLCLRKNPDKPKVVVNLIVPITKEDDDKLNSFQASNDLSMFLAGGLYCQFLYDEAIKLAEANKQIPDDKHVHVRFFKRISDQVNSTLDSKSEAKQEVKADAQQSVEAKQEAKSDAAKPEDSQPSNSPRMNR